MHGVEEPTLPSECFVFTHVSYSLHQGDDAEHDSVSRGYTETGEVHPGKAPH